MADKDIPLYRCTYCLQAIPEDRDQHLFGSSFLRPKSDDADHFVADAQAILRYASAVALVSNGAEKISDELVTQLRDLVDDLIEEARRRLARAEDAFWIQLMRQAEAEKASASQPEGRA